MTWSPSRLLLALASCIFLAWSLQRSLDGVTLREPGVSAYTITPATPAGEVWLRHVIVDGRALSMIEVPRTGSWKNESWALVHRPNDGPAAMTLRGRNVTACFLATRWAGGVHVDGVGLRSDVNLFRDSEETGLTCLDLADGRLASHGTNRDRRDGLRTVLALLPILAIAWFWKPWNSSGRLEGWVVLHMSALHVLVWLTQAVGYNSDAIGYVGGAAMNLKGIATHFPPGYPLFLAIAGATPGFSGLSIAAVQHVLMVLTLVALQRMTRVFLPADLASLGLLVTGSLSPTLVLPQTILSENVALFGMAGALWFASRSDAIGAARRDVAAGLIAGFATISRVVPILALAIPLFLLFVSHHGLTRRAAVRTARVLAIGTACVLVTSAWLWRSGFTLATSTGLHLYNRVVAEQLLLDREGDATRRFLGIVGERPLLHVPHWDIQRDLYNAGLSYGTHEQLLGAVAWEGARTAPWAFARHSIVMTGREYVGDPMSHVPWSGVDAQRIPAIENEPVLGFRSAALLWRHDLDWMFGRVWLFLMWGPLAGLLLVPLLPRAGQLTYLALFTVALGYLFAGTLFEFFIERYVLPVLPFLAVLTPAPLAALQHLWRRR